MPRPSRVDEAKTKLQAHYAEHGGMPSIQAFAELMGYASPSSAHDVTNALVEQGFLAKDARGGRLLPGAKFGHKRRRTPSIPVELLDALPVGFEWHVLKVSEGSGLVGDGVLAGDYLIWAASDLAELAGSLLLGQGRRYAIAAEPVPGWKVRGVVVAQFRSYRANRR